MQRLSKFLSMFPFNLLPFLGKRPKLQEGEIHYVGGTRRYMSILIDLAVMLMVLQITHVLFFSIFPKNASMIISMEKYKMDAPLTQEEKVARNKYVFYAAALQVVQLVMIFTYNVYMWVNFSATIGKFLLGIRVVDECTMKKMTVIQATKRFFSVPLSGIPLGLGIIWANFDARKRTWHDKIAGTVVITYKSLKKANNDSV